MSREAMQLALEALESDPISHAGLVSRKQAITALRQALEEKHDYVIDCPRCGHCCAERTWVGLTDKDLEALFLNEDSVRFARYIESRLKDKNA